MNNHFLLFIIIIIKCFLNVYSENAYYIVSIIREKTDNNYDEESQLIQEKIDNLVNDKMNDIYDVIENNKESYILNNGKLDEKLEELNSIPMEKRNNKNKKFLFINKRKKKHNHIKRSSDLSNLNNNSTVDYIPMESKLVNHICPISNYYAINVYLSEKTAKIVCNFKNVLFCEKSETLTLAGFDQNENENNSTIYYDIDDIKRETSWGDVSVQPVSFTPNYLSLLSQSPYIDINKPYDNNFYYPSSAGHNIDIYLVDQGIIVYHEDYNTYEGTSYERTITCDGVADSNGFFPTTKEGKKVCTGYGIDLPNHGIMTSSMAGGTILGVAKKANIHMIASDFTFISLLRSYDYILQNATPHKTVVSLSVITKAYSKACEDKLVDLIMKGLIVITAAGNGNNNCCSRDIYGKDFYSNPGYRLAITVGAVNSKIFNNGYHKASYSNYGDCIDIFAPGEVIAPLIKNNATSEYRNSSGTSCSTPIVAGVAASIMSEHPEIEFNQELMRKTLIEMSIKNEISDLNSSTNSNDIPNRFINNGKRKIYSPEDTYDTIQCGISSKNKATCTDGCCSKDGKCIKFINNPWDQCLIENGCQNDFGYCTTKEKSMEECENEIKEYEECLFEFSHDKNSQNNLNNCQSFKSDKCNDFYKNLYMGRSVCSLAKNYKSFGFIDNFDKGKYNQYGELCNLIAEKYTKDCKIELSQYRYNKCSLETIDFDNLLSPGMEGMKKIINKCVEFKSDECIHFYNNIDEIINDIPSCSLIKTKFNIDITNEYHLNSNDFDSFNNYCENYVLKNSISYCKMLIKDYEECQLHFSTNITKNEIIKNCSTFESDKCQEFYFTPDILPICSYNQNDQKYDILENLEENKSNYINICRSNNVDLKEEFISDCKTLVQNNQCHLNYYPEMSETEFNLKCNIIKTKGCQEYNPINILPVCKLAHLYNNDNNLESLISNYNEQYAIDAEICQYDEYTSVQLCDSMITLIKVCLFNNKFNYYNIEDYKYQCSIIKDYLNAFENKCQLITEGQIKDVSYCLVAQRYKSYDFNFLTELDINWEYYNDFCS